MTTVESAVRRVDVVDLGRGAVMALMALDHTRTFLTNVTYNPSDLTRTFPSLFLTRWVSHLCTPLFLFLAGTGVYFMVGRRHRGQAAGRLVTRGLALIVLELTVVRWGWYFNLDYRHTSLQVLWAIGASMILMAPLIVLPSRMVGAIGLAIVALHNAVGPMVRDSSIGESWPWALLYERGRVLALAGYRCCSTSFMYPSSISPPVCARGRQWERPVGCSPAHSIAGQCRCLLVGGWACPACTPAHSSSGGAVSRVSSLCRSEGPLTLSLAELSLRSTRRGRRARDMRWPRGRASPTPDQWEPVQTTFAIWSFALTTPEPFFRRALDRQMTLMAPCGLPRTTTASPTRAERDIVYRAGRRRPMQ